MGPPRSSWRCSRCSASRTNKQRTTHGAATSQGRAFLRTRPPSTALTPTTATSGTWLRHAARSANKARPSLTAQIHNGTNRCSRRYALCCANYRWARCRRRPNWSGACLSSTATSARRCGKVSVMPGARCRSRLASSRRSKRRFRTERSSTRRERARSSSKLPSFGALRSSQARTGRA